MEGVQFSKRGSHLSAAQTRLEHLQNFHGWKINHVEHVALAFWHRAHSSYKFARRGFNDVGRLVLALGPRTYVQRRLRQFQEIRMDGIREIMFWHGLSGCHSHVDSRCLEARE
eukprot:5242275-Pyramimonas_sp.AAC.1